MTNRLAAGMVIFRRFDGDWRCLMLRAYRNWDFPKGLIEPGEDALADIRVKSLVGAHGLTQLIKGALFQFDGFDPVVIGSIALLMVGVAVAAAGVPALRASWRLPQLHD